MSVNQLRPLHIQNLGVHCGNMQIKKLNEIYSVPFTCTNGPNVLDIILPPDFPNSMPILRLQSPMTHSILTQDRRTVSPTAIRFNRMVPSLGEAVNAVIKALSTGSLLMPSMTPQQMYGIPTAPMGVTYNMYNPRQATELPMAAQTNASMVRAMGGVGIVPQQSYAGTLQGEDLEKFNDLSEDEIQKMLDDDELVAKFVEELPSLGKLTSDLAAVDKKIEDIKGELATQEYSDPTEDDNTELRKKVSELNAKVTVLREKNNDAIRNKKILRTRIMELNKKSEAIFDDFIAEDDVTVDEFIDAYLANREEYHKADVKCKAISKV